MCEGDEVFELRLNDFVCPLALPCNGIVANIAFAVDLQRECVARGGLRDYQAV